jgi:hypothetical protein
MNNENLLGKSLLIVGLAMFFTASANANQPMVNTSHGLGVVVAKAGNNTSNAKEAAQNSGSPQAKISGVVAKASNNVFDAKEPAQNSGSPQVNKLNGFGAVAKAGNNVFDAKVGYINCGANEFVQPGSKWLQQVSTVKPNMIKLYSASVSITAPKRILAV